MKKIIDTILILAFMFLLRGVELKAEEPENHINKPYTSSTSFSLLMTSGNTKKLTIGFDTEQSLRLDKNQVQFKGSVIYGRNDGIKNAEFYFGHLKYTYELSPKVFLLGLGRFEKNAQAGYKHRYSLSTGAGFNWINKTKISASSEASLGWSHESNLGQDASILSFLSLLVASSVKVSLSSKSHISCQELFSLNLKDSKDFRLSSEISVTADISKALALKFSYQLFYKHKSIPGFQNLDHYFLSSLVLNL
jgi:putative salt-induced outer membrane protein YdiY